MTDWEVQSVIFLCLNTTRKLPENEKGYCP